MTRPPARIPLREALDRLTEDTPSACVLDRPEVSVYIYAPAVDLQSPHSRAEEYVVLQGSGTLAFGTREVAFAPSDLIHVPAGLPHRFRVQEGGPLVVWVVFMGPELAGQWTPEPAAPDLEEISIAFPLDGAEVAAVTAVAGGGRLSWESQGLGTVAGLVFPRQPSTDPRLMVGSAAYELTDGGRGLAAAWAHPDIGLRLGTGTAQRVGPGAGFEGAWDIQYLLPDEDPKRPTLELLRFEVRPSGDIFELTWKSKNTDADVYKGIGIIRDGVLLAGWGGPGAPISYFRVELASAVLDRPPRLEGELVTAAGVRQLVFARAARLGS